MKMLLQNVDIVKKGFAGSSISCNTFHTNTNANANANTNTSMNTDTNTNANTNTNTSMNTDTNTNGNRKSSELYCTGHCPILPKEVSLQDALSS